MIENIIGKTNEAKALLKEVKQVSWTEDARARLKSLLKKAVCCKLMIAEDEADEIRKLVILSIKQQNKEDAALPDHVIQSKIEKYDCHQSSLVSQKKTLLILFIERELGLHFSDEEAIKIKTIDDLCSAVIRSSRAGE